MKKIVTCCMVALMAMTFVFAANHSSDVNLTNPASKTVDVTASLTLDDSNFAGYRFGFCDDAPGDLNSNKVDLDNGISTLTEKTDVALEYTGNGAADNTKDKIWYYFKVRSGSNVSLSIVADPFKETAPGNSRTINYLIGETPVEASDTPVVTVQKFSGFKAGSGELVFTIPEGTLDAGDIGTYEATITFTLKTEA